MQPTGHRGRAAFTLIELLLVIAIIAILAGLYLPTLGRAKAKAHRIKCVSNLRQVGLSFRMFSEDNNNKFPMQVPRRAGGSLEFVTNGNAFRHFQVLSNSLGPPEILACPADKGTIPTLSWSALNNTNISYFVGLDARPGKANHILAGDRNITNQFAVSGAVLPVIGGDPIGWTRDIHYQRGNILFADSHVEQLDDEGLRTAIRNQGRIGP